MANLNSCIDAAQKAPRRISITVPDQVHVALVQRSFYEGRSISNLASFLLENSLMQPTPVGRGVSRYG